jgi:GxxExxY protein
MLKHHHLTDQIINAFCKVYNTLGFGFLEKVYENALALELRKRGLDVVSQVPVQVYYEGQPVGNYFADLLVQSLIILELKAASSIASEHGMQLVNYLKASRLEVGLVLNFGMKPEFQRRIFDHPTGISSVEEDS